jgi:hypothetical protein
MSEATYLMMAALLGRTGGDYYKLRGPVTAPWAHWGWGRVVFSVAGHVRVRGPGQNWPVELVRLEGEADAYVRAQ